MATLSAHGKELARMERFSTTQSGASYRVTRALFEDRVILEKKDFYKPSGNLDFSSGWKKSTRIKVGIGHVDWVKQYLHDGWKIV